MLKQKFMTRCAERAGHVRVLGDGTFVVPSVSSSPNRTVAAWMQFLNLGIDSKIMILGAEYGRCWIKYPGERGVTAYG